MAYPSSNSILPKLQFYARQNTKAFIIMVSGLIVLLIVTSDYVAEAARGTSSATKQRLRGHTSTTTTTTDYARMHWGGAHRDGYFSSEDSLLTPSNADSSTRLYRFAAVTDLDQLSLLQDKKKPTFHSVFLPGILKRIGIKQYEINFETPRTLITQHNEAGRGAEFSELVIYNQRLLTFDDRTGDVFEIINSDDGTQSNVVPRFVITEGEGDTDKGMKWEWATVKDGELYMGSMGKEYTRPDGSIQNENNLWIGILNERGELRRENWKKQFSFVRHVLEADPPGYLIHEAILWSDHLQRWVFLPRRISNKAYDEVQDEHNGGNKLVLVDENFEKYEIVTINMEADGLRGFSSFAFVPGTNDRHALAIRSVEENCTGEIDVCQQRSYFLVFDVKTGEVLSTEKKYKENLKFEGVEFVNIHAVPPP